MDEVKSKKTIVENLDCKGLEAEMSIHLSAMEKQ